jgi:K+-sensing histidine kinase KdpD
MRKFTFAYLDVAGWLAVLACAALALALSLFFRGYGLRSAVPVMFLLVIITVAHLFNRLAGLVVATIACLVFASVLFEPYGSLAIYDATDRLVLSCFVLAALAVVFLSPKSNGNKLARAWLRR